MGVAGGLAAMVQCSVAPALAEQRFATYSGPARLRTIQEIGLQSKQRCWQQGVFRVDQVAEAECSEAPRGMA